MQRTLSSFRPREGHDRRTGAKTHDGNSAKLRLLVRQDRIKEEE
jgi:hypothetical protein